MTFADWTGWRGPGLIGEFPPKTPDTGDTAFWAGRVSIYDVIHWSLLHLPLPGVPVVAGQGEAMPIFVVQLRMIRPIIVSRPPRFSPEQGMLRDAFRGQDPVFKLPCALKLVKVFGPEMGEIFLQHAEQLKPAGK